MRLFKTVHAYDFGTVTISSGESSLVLENRFGKQDERKLEVLVAKLGLDSKKVQERRRAKSLNFAEVNKITEIVPMTEGDIRKSSLAIAGFLFLILQLSFVLSPSRRHRAHTRPFTLRVAGTSGMRRCHLG